MKNTCVFFTSKLKHQRFFVVDVIIISAMALLIIYIYIYCLNHSFVVLYVSLNVLSFVVCFIISFF